MAKITLDQKNVLAAEANIPATVQVTMLNLLAFKEIASYEDADRAPCTGMEAYLKRYAPAFNEVAKELGVEGIEVLYIGNVAETILGPVDPKWDMLALVRYPSFSALRKVIESAIYMEKAEPHRIAALEAWEFIATFSPSDS